MWAERHTITMVVSLTKYIYCRCPNCGRSAVIAVTPFDANGNFSYSCDLCGAEYLHFRKAHGKKFRLEVRCYVCDGLHHFDLGLGDIWGGESFSVACPPTCIDLCYIGDRDEAARAGAELEENLRKLINNENTDMYNDTEPILREAVAELNLKVNSGHVLCMCASSTLNVNLGRGGLTIICGSCGGKEFIPMETE